MPEAHPENVPGDFYVEMGCCTLCDVPMVEAPSLFTYIIEENQPYHCYVSKQPSSDGELNAMLAVICCSETECIRYRGKDASLIRRIEEMGTPNACDYTSVDGEIRAREQHSGQVSSTAETNESLGPITIGELLQARRKKWWQFWK